MKRKLLLLPLLALPVLFLRAAVPSPQNITFTWVYPTNLTPDDSLVFKIYSSASANAPKPWAVMSTAPSTQRSLVVSVAPSQKYYYIAASNFWGEADPSNVVGTPPSPLSGVLSVTKGP